MGLKNKSSDDNNNNKSFLNRKHWARKSITKEDVQEVDQNKLVHDEDSAAARHIKKNPSSSTPGNDWARRAIVKMTAASTVSKINRVA